MRLLLDTCLVSEFFKARPNPGVQAWLEHQSEDELFVSTILIGELHKGFAKDRDPERRKRHEAFAEEHVFQRFADRTLETDRRVWRHWGTLCGEAERKGAPLSSVDALVAALAFVNDMTIVTRNEADFARCGVVVLNPWSR